MVHGSRCARLSNPILLLAAALLGVVAACSTPPSPLTVSLTSPADGPARVRVDGLSSDEASALRSAALDGRGWRDILRVTATADASIAVAGRYSVVGTSIEFEPTFPFDAGRRYLVTLDVAAVSSARTGQPRVVTDVTLPAAPLAPPVTVTAIYPSAEEWPANTLRFYVHFSGPMARETGAGRVRILDDHGVEVPDALLPSTIDFWSPDQQRYTVFFEPGRLKRGIKPNRDMGRALVSRQTFTIVVDTEWRDAQGRRLAREFRRTIHVGPEREQALSLDDWKISSPAAGTRAPLVVRVPWPIDRALFLRAVGLMAGGTVVEGDVELAEGETQWRLTPPSPWARGSYELVVLSLLEDVSGNRIGRPFEVLPTDPAAGAVPPERFTRPVLIR